MKIVHRPPRPWKQAIYLWIGIILIPVGIIIAPLPGPGGIPVLAVAALLIITSSRRAASWVRLHRSRWDWMNDILVKGEGWLGGEFGRALRRTNGRPHLVPKPPESRRERILDILLFPVHVAIILTRAVANRFGWKLPGDARKERKAERARRKMHRQHRRRRQSAGVRAKTKPKKSKAPSDRAAAVSHPPERRRRSSRRRRGPVPIAASVPSPTEP
jgi:hypothetical protein